MPAPDRQRRANLTLAAFLAIGALVWAITSLLTGDVRLGLAYGVIPGVLLGVLARWRIIRGGLVRRPRTPDNPDFE